MITETGLEELLIKAGGAVLGLIIFAWIRKIVLRKERFF